MADVDPVAALWERAARRLHWTNPWRSVLEPATGHGSWFAGATTNLSTNALDRHLEARGDVPAFHWEGEPGDRRSVTYRELYGEVCACADALRSIGVGQGDMVAIHLGLVPEAVVAMLACARIGAVHAVFPSVLPPVALSDRLLDLQPRVLFTQDGAWRHGVILPLKSRADEALSAAASIEQTIVVRRTGTDVAWYEGDRWYHELLASPRRGSDQAELGSPVTDVPADAPSLVTYVANRRGRPTGIVHGTGGLMVYCHAIHVDALTNGVSEILWFPVEIGWLALQTHGILGPLLAGATTVLYEGMLDTPDHRRAWQIVDRYGVDVLVATPSVVRALREWPDASPSAADVASLRFVVTVGEPIEAPTAEWLRRHVAHDRATVADGWGQTELGGIVTVQPPRTIDGALPDAGLTIVDDRGTAVASGSPGDLVLCHPWPATALRIHGSDVVPGFDPALPGRFVTGDRARHRPDGTIEFLGRRDQVFSVSGQLVSEEEVREVLEEHPFVEQAVVVDRPDRRTGRAVVAVVSVAGDVAPTERLAAELRDLVSDTLGGLSVPRTIALVSGFPEALDRDALRMALQRLCSVPEPTLHLSRAQILAQVDAGDAVNANLPPER